jgi:hypothetical protein
MFGFAGALIASHSRIDASMIIAMLMTSWMEGVGWRAGECRCI